MAPFRAKPSFIVHGTRPARYGDDKFYPPPTPPGTPTSMDAQSNQSFNDDWKMPRGLVWKTYWQRALDDVKYHTLVVYAHVFRETNIGLVLVFLALILTSINTNTTGLLEIGVEHDALQWCLLLVTGLTGSVIHGLLTISLRMERAGRASNLICFQIAFALVIERAASGAASPWTSFLGGIIIIAAAVRVGL